MNYEEALKRLKQETCPCTYNPDFDKDECLKVLENVIKDKEQIIQANNRQIVRYNEDLVELRIFAEIMCSGADIYANCISFEYTQVDYGDKIFDLVKKMVEKYGKKKRFN